MATFRFKTVLKLRKYREDQRKHELAAALAVEQQRKDDALRFARLRQEQTERVRNRLRSEGEINVRSIIEDRSYVGLLDREIRDQLICVARAEHETSRRRTRLAEATVRRKALEVLQDRALVARQADENRRETAELDEVGLRICAAGRGADA